MFRAQSGLTHLEAVVVMLYSTSTVLPHHELERQKAGIGLSLVGCCGCPSPFTSMGGCSLQARPARREGGTSRVLIVSLLLKEPI